MRVRLALVSVVAVGLVCSSWILGQDQPTRGRGSLPANWARLGLSDEQKQEIYTIRAEYRAKIDALNKQIRDLRAKENAELRKVLTDAQKARLKEILAARAGDEQEKKPASPDKEEKKPPSPDKK